MQFWWRAYNDVHDEVSYQLKSVHSVMNVITFWKGAMVLALLFLSFRIEEDGMEQSEQQIFVYLLYASIVHTGMIFGLLLTVVDINKDMHGGVLADLKMIALLLRGLDCGRSGGGEEERERRRSQAERIEKVYIARLEAKPMLVGRLLMARVILEMVKRAAGAVAVAMFSAIVRAGLGLRYIV